VAKVPRLRLAIVKQSDDTKGFVVLPLAETLVTFVSRASIQLAIKRLARA
jgi:hypothetical protein